MKINNKIILVIIFLLTLSFRLYLSFTNSSFSSDDSYFNLRVTQHIIENKNPLVYDELSYSGRNFIYPQFFNYLLALFSFIPEYEKIIPSILISSIIFIVYLISKRITNSANASLFIAFISAFIPIEIRTTANQISVYSLVIPIILLMILCLLNLETKKYFNLFILLSFLLPLIHPTSFLFAFSLLFYLILINTESINVTRYKKEIILFSFFVILIINFFLYKSALVKYGMNIIWQNIPGALFNEYFRTFNLLEVLYLVGVVPLILGAIGIYTGLFKKKDENMVLLSSFILSSLLLMSLKIISLQAGVLFIALPLLIASSKSLYNLYYYFSLTKFEKVKRYFNIIFFIIILALSLIPSIFIALSLPNYNQDAEVFKWLHENTEKSSVILAPIELGNVLTYYADRKNVADNNFLLAPNVEERLNDIQLIYISPFEIKGLELIKKYNINYIYAPAYYLNKFNLQKIPYIDDEKCFELVKKDVYKIKC